MAVPPLGATGLDGSDPATFAAGSGMLAPSSMGASEAFRGAVSGSAIDRPNVSDYDEEGGLDDDARDPLTEAEALSLLRDASSQSRSFFEAFVHAPWQRSYRAIRNEHFQGSLYLSEPYKTRSKIFKPKTRSALRKRLATTAKAMFTPGDVVSVQPENESDDQQIASAALKQEIINYRLSTPTLRNGIPWFLTAMGARFDAEVTSLCCSKQFWNYKEIDTGKMEIAHKVDPETGEVHASLQPKKLVLIDKPDIMLIEPENVRFDPNCNWTNVAQLSAYVLLQFAMTPDEAWDMVRQNQRSKVPWKKSLTAEMFRVKAGGSTPSETTAPRSAREGGRDPKQQASGAFKPVWLTEVFMRYQGRDYVYWAMNDSEILSDPTPVEVVYPWAYGERPITIGMGQLEPHRTYQMSAVESWQQSQQETNDLANLRLDREKQIVSPPIKVLRGQKVDLAQVQRKGPNSILMVQSMADIEPLELPDVPGSLFNEGNLLNNDIDELSGNFDGSSVQANRNMNETVGGMHLLSESGNQVSDFDLSVWTETWAQPTILQLLKLEEYYETDEKVLAICGQRAKLWERYGVNEITDEFLRAETTAKVNLGIGATSLPMERVKRFSLAWDTAAKALAPFVQSKAVDVEPNAENIVNDIFAAANFRDGGSRYFQYVGPPKPPTTPPQPDPKVLMAQAVMQKNQITQEANQGKMILDAHRLRANQEDLHAKLLNDHQDRIAAIDLEHMKTMAEVERARESNQAAGASQARDHIHAHASNFISALAQHLAPQKPSPGQNGGGSGPGGVTLGASKKFDEARPMMAPLPSPRIQAQPAVYANLSDAFK